MTFLTRFAIAGAVIAVTSCQSEASREQRRAALRRYEDALVDWRRDSSVIDSLARLVKVDSLIRLRRSTLQAGSERPYRQAALCEQYRLTRRHGSRPTELAVKRLDTAFTATELQRFDDIRAASGPILIEVGDAVCAVTGPIAPREVAGVSLNQSNLRPLHPDSTLPPR